MLVACLAACGGGGGGPEGIAAAAASGSTAALAATPALAEAPPPTASTRLTLRGSADGSGDAVSSVQVRHDGLVLGAFEIRPGTADIQPIDVPRVIDRGVLELVWQNPADGLGRSLTIDTITVGSQTLSPVNSDVIYDLGEGPAAFDGMTLLPGQSTLTRSGALRFAFPSAAKTATALSSTKTADPPPVDGYFIDANLGNDSNPGTIDLPWRSLSRAAAMRLSAGQGLYLRCGSTWRESLSLGASNLVNGATIAGYGSECGTKKAVITGADDFSGGWQKSGNVWAKGLPAGTAKITQLFMSGQALRTAQWPNAETGSSRMALATGETISSNAVDLKASDSALLAGMDLSGATVHVRTQPWKVETRRVLSGGGSSLQLETSTQWPIQGGVGLILQDKRWMLDAPGEFFHDTAAQRLYLISPAAGAPVDINKATIEGSVRDIALALTQRSKLVLRDLSLRAARGDGLLMIDAPEPSLERIEARDNMAAGMRLWQWEPLAPTTPGPTITDSLVAGNGQYGIDAQHVARAQIKRNRVLSTGSAPHHVAGVHVAIASGPGSVTEDNVVDGAGYIGISFSSSSGSVVARNTVSGYCTRLSDCGAIYTWTGGRAPPSAALASTVEDNRVFAAQAQMAGTPSDSSYIVAGVYIDDMSHGATVRNNFLYGMPIGVLVHNASSVRVTGNSINLPSRAAIFATMDQTDADWMRDNTFSDNQIVPLVQARALSGGLPNFEVSQTVWFLHSLAGTNALVAGRNVFSRNTVVQLQGPVAKYAWVNGPEGERFIDAQDWTALNASEPSPQRPLDYTPLLTTFGPELVQDGQFDTGLNAWRTWRHSTSRGGDAQALTNSPDCEGACLRFTSGSSADLLFSRPFSMRAGAPHVFRWTATASGQNGATVGWPYISREVTPWDEMADTRGFVGYTPRRIPGLATLSYETYFVAKAADAARANLALDTVYASVVFDKVSVREVTGYAVAAAADWSALAQAPRDAARNIGCAELGWATGCAALGLDGQAVSLPMVLAAGTQRLLLRADSPFKR